MNRASLAIDNRPTLPTGTRRCLGLLTAGISVLGAATLGACGGGGPGVSGPAAQSLFADYSATWGLDSLASDPAPELGDLLPERPRGGRLGGSGRPGGSRPGGGPPGGGRPGTGMTPPSGIGGGRGGGFDPDAIQANRHLMAAASHRPTRLTLAVDDSLFTLQLPPARRTAVPIDGETVEVHNGIWPARARVTWTDRQPSLERTFEHGGTLVDHFEVVDRTRLIMTRTVELGRGRTVEMVFVYNRDDG